MSSTKYNWVQAEMFDKGNKGEYLKLPIYYVESNDCTLMRIELDWSTKTHKFNDLWSISLFGGAIVYGRPGLAENFLEMQLVAESKLFDLVNDIHQKFSK